MSNNESNLSLNSSKELLNYTGVPEIDFDFLQKKYNDDSKRFYRYIDFSLKKSKAKQDIYANEDNNDLDIDSLLVMKGELMITIDNLATQQRFLELIEGIDNDEEQDTIYQLLCNEFPPLKIALMTTLKKYNQKLKELSAEKESKDDKRIDDKKIDDKKIDDKKNEDLNIILPMNTPNFARQSESIPNLDEDVETFLGTRRRSETFTHSNTFRQPEFESRANQDNLIVNQESTPVRSNVRFSDVVTSRVLSDHSTEISSDDSWKFVEPITDKIEELSLIEDLQEICAIVAKKITNDLKDIELHSLEKRDCARLKNLKSEIEKKSINLPVVCNANLKHESVQAFKCATKWIRSVENLIYERGLHLQSERKHSKPLELAAFKGHSDITTNIYEFFSNYEVIARGFNEEDKALYLYANYLDETIKTEVRHIRTNYAQMKVTLIRKHGNINTLLLHKRNQIKKLKSVHIRSTRNEKIKYVKAYVEVLEQIRSLVEMNTKDYPDLKVEAFSYANVTDLAKLLPDFLFRSFSQKYVKETSKKKQEALSGQETFIILMDIMKDTLKDLEFTAELYMEETSDKQEGKPAAVAKPKVFSYESASKESTRSTSKSFDGNKYFGAPCIAHPTMKRKVKDCLLGRCKIFLEMKPAERETMAENKNVCKLCLLFPCKKKQSAGVCILKKALPEGIVCKECLKDNVYKNILLCSIHSNTSNDDILTALSEFLPGFRKDTNIELFVGKIFKLEHKIVPKPTRKNDLAFDITTGQTISKADVYFKTKQDSSSLSVYPTQIINLHGVHTQVLFDSGALGEMIKKDVAEQLKLSILDEQGQSYTVAGGQVVHTKCPLYELTLGPNDEGNFFSFPLIGVDKISNELPEVDLTDVVAHVKKTLVSFPESKSTYPKKLGGSDIHLIIGIKQSHIFPTREYVFEDGLQVWRSPLRDIYGSNIIFAGPVEVVKKAYNLIGPTFFQENCRVIEHFRPSLDLNSILDDTTEEMVEDNGEEINTFFKVLYDKPKQSSDILTPNKVNLSCQDCVICDSCKFNFMKFKPAPRLLEKEFEEQETAGTTVDYRCPDCAICKKCKESDRTRAVSVKEMAEDILIANSVSVDVEKRVTTCCYPFTEEPTEYMTKLWGGKTENLDMAVAVLNTQRKKSAEVRASVVKFNSEVYKKGFVAPLKELSVDIQNEIMQSKFRHFFVWRSVAKPDSLSTPQRLVVDPSMSGFNNIIAKGQNCLTNLFKIIINWRCNKYIFTSDVEKMFNTLKLTPEMYKFSLYLFSESLDPVEDYDIWCNLTLMYGVKSASAQATFGLRQTTEIKKESYPLAHQVIHDTTYMDDSSGGANDKETRDEMINQLQEVLPFGGFKIKVVTKNGEDPSDKCSSDGISTSFGGYRWKPKKDVMMYKCQEINFNTRRRGSKKDNPFAVDSEEDLERLLKNIKFTKANLLGKVLEFFDLVGLFEPLKVHYKIDLHKLPVTDLDEEVTGEFREKWIQNLKLMFQSRLLEIPRSCIPEEAINGDNLELIVCCDAALTMCGCAVYVRTQSQNGTYHVRLLTARSKSVYYSIPRNELMSCVLAAETTYTVCKALENRVSSLILVTDSSIALAWISNEKAKLKQFIHSRVKHITRLIGSDKFYLISTHDNPADLLTRGSATFDDVKADSEWQLGKSWMRMPVERMPIKSYEEVCKSMTPENIADIEKEVHKEFPAINHLDDTDCIETDCFCVDDLTEVKSCEDICDISSDDSLPTILKSTICKVKPVTNEASTKESENKSPYTVDFVRFGFRKAFLHLAFIMRFISRVKHMVHINQKNVEFSTDCSVCQVKSKLNVRGFDKLTKKESSNSSRITCSPLDLYLAWNSLCRIGSKEVKAALHHTKIAEFEEKDEILYGGGRLSYPTLRIETTPAVHELDFVQPVFLVSSPVTYAICLYVHWELCPHSGVDRTTSFVSKIIHVPRIRKLVKLIRNSCTRCRFLLKKHYLPLTGNQAIYSLMKATPFFSCMIDVAGVYQAHDSIRKRVTKPAYFLVQVCLLTGCTSIGVLEDLSTSSILFALTRSANRYGWSKYLVLDNQSSFKALEKAKLSFKDLAGRLWNEQNMILDYSCPLGHNERGRVESKIKVLKDFLEKGSLVSSKHSYLELETIGLNVATMINSLPITANQDDQANTMGELGLICPNLFIMGRNNARSPERFVSLDFNPAKALKELAATNEKLTEILGDFIPRFIPGKRFTDVRPPEKNDVVLFVAKESNRSRNIEYKYGKIIETNVDGRINKVLVEYRNADECVKRKVERNIKDLVLILSSDEIDFNSAEHQLASWVQQKYL